MAMEKFNVRIERLRELVQGQLEGLSKWQLALLFGTPVTLGLAGFIYYKSKKHKKKSDGKGNNAASTTTATAGVKNKVVKEAQVCFLCLSKLQPPCSPLLFTISSASPFMKICSFGYVVTS